MDICSNKVSIIGCGKVGMTAAFALLLDGTVEELVLYNRTIDKIIGEQLDLEHALPFLNRTQIKATNRFEDIADSKVVVVTAGAAQAPGETRLQLTQRNVAIIEDIISQIVKHAPQAIILIVANPVDVLTYHAYRVAGLPKGQIFGSGTVLDTARFRYYLAEFLKVNPKSIHAYVLGEHGDSSFPMLSSATVGSQLLPTFPNYSQSKAMDAFDKTRKAAYKIIDSKGATFYAIGVVITNIVKNILRNNRSVLPVSMPLHNFYGHSGVALSVPCIVGETGVSQILDVKLSWEEKKMLDKSVETIKSFL
jgi:L-lactate dehydrogenase